MSTRRSGRAKAPVKYTSESDSGSDFEATTPKKKTPSKKKAAPTPKKRATEAGKSSAATPAKRQKRDPETIAAELREKAAAQEEKAEAAAHKKRWEEWQAAHDAGGTLLDDEPEREASITQTDAGTKYGLKPAELGSLRHFEKRNPNYGNTMKIFVEEDVKVLAWRKGGLLAGETEEKKVLAKGEEVWKEEHGSPASSTPQKSVEKEKALPTTPKAKTPKQKWTEYITTHALTENDKLKDEPAAAVNQTDSKTRFNLTPQELAVLPYFPKPNPKYGNTTKCFDEGEVKALAYRKAAVLEGVEEGDEVKLLERGKELVEKEGKEKD